MHVRSVSVRNFRAIHEKNIQFEDATGSVRPITVLAGPNGCGKTSVLFAIVQALRGTMGARIPDVPPPSDDDLHRAEPSGRSPVSAMVRVELAFAQDELEAIPRIFEKTQGLRERDGKPKLSGPPLSNGRLRVEWQYPPRVRRDGSVAPMFELRSDPDKGAVWLAGAKFAWRCWKNRLLTDVRDMYRIGMLRVFPQDRDRRWGIDVDDVEDTADAGEFNPGPLGPRAPSSEEPTVAEALRRLGEWAHGQGLPDDDDRRRWESQLQERFKKICGPKEYLGYWLDHPRYGETPLLRDGAIEYPFRLAASGELVVFHYLTKFTFPRPVHNSLILIDEPELHLHPRWIRQLYRALPQMGDNNQFIMTTHSPELRQIAAEDNALIDLGRLDSPSESPARA